MNESSPILDKKVRITAFISVAVIAVVWILISVFPHSNEGEVAIESVIYINRDPVQSLVRLPGIGFTMASEIVSFREKTGLDRAFKSVDDLCKVDGMGRNRAKAILPYISFD